MKKLLIMLLILSCGKNEGKKSAPIPTKIETVETVAESKLQEMIAVECRIKDSCQKPCIDASLDCEGTCNLRYTNTRSKQWDECASACGKEAEACFSKEIEITKEEYDMLYPI